MRSSALLAGLALGLSTPVAGTLVVYRVPPQTTDASIHRFTEPHYVTFDPDAPASADLLLFLSGSGGTPTGAIDFLNIAAAQGYRVISLAYNDTPAVVSICGQNADAGCSADVRQKRIFGDNATNKIDDTPAESIVNRLSKLLAALDRDHPGEGWGAYLDAGAPKWARIAVSGHSQGAGMAAYIAQRRLVARAILFSSPWDFYGRSQQLAPWITVGPGATPPDRWFAAYHKKENTADLIARAYSALKIPAAHIRMFTLEPGLRTGLNPYHLSMLGSATTPRDRNGSPAYADDWRFLVGPAPAR
jgi:predicted esterase